MTPTTEKLVEIENGTLFTRVYGSGKALVLIHGMATDHRLWTPQIEALAARFQVISYDMRGFGRSSRPDGPYRAEDDLACLLQQLGIPSAHLVGLSLGSSVATRFALSYPAMTGSLIIAGPVLQGFSDAPDFMQALKSVWGIAREQGIEAARTAWATLPLFSTLPSSSEWSSLLDNMITDYDGWHWQHRDPEIWPETMPADRLAEITAPTLIITGDQEMAGLVRAGTYMSEKINGCRTIKLEACGHVVNLEKPEEFNRAMIEFLTDS